MSRKLEISEQEYARIHYWMRKNFPREKCEGLNCTGLGSRLEWALVTGKKYEKVRENFICLCPSCHRKYDMTEETRKKIGDIRRGIKFTPEESAKHFISVVQLSENGSFIRRFISISEAAENTGSSVSSISGCLRGRYKYTGDRRDKTVKNYWILNKDYEKIKFTQGKI